MSSLFADTAAEMSANAPSPDAAASTLENTPIVEKKKRGRKPGQKVTAKAEPQKTAADFTASAKAVNTIIFSMACVMTSTKEAWPSDEKTEVMDKALSRYMEIKDFASPPELALIAAYAGYVQEIGQKKEVQENLAKRFGGFFAKFSIVRKLASKFKRNPK